MKSRSLKKHHLSSKRNSQTGGLSISSVIFHLFILPCVAYNVYQFSPSHENASPNISQSRESAVSGAVNDNQIRSNKGDNAKIVNNMIFSKAKGKYQINNTTTFNGTFVNKSEVNCFENDRTEKPRTIFLKADKEKPIKKIKDDQKYNFDVLLMNGIFKAKISNGFQKMNRRMSTEKNGKKKNIDHLLLEKMLFSKENDQDEHSATDIIIYFGCGLTVFVILTINVLYYFVKIVKTNNSRFLFQNTSYHSRSSKTFLMALGLLLSYAPVSSDVTLSTQGTYFQNEAPGRRLKGYVSESSVVPSLFHCQMRCDTLHLTCKSLNYIENEDGSNICEINYDAKYCALPGDFIVKENLFYVETMLEKDDAGLCSTCGYKGVIKKTKEIPGFVCLCQEGVYGDICQYVDECSKNPCHSNATCKNTLGSFLCTCKAGYIGDGLICTDVDECSKNPCHSNATCNNTLGSFLCTCKTGYIGEGLNCSGCPVYSSCLDALQRTRNAGNGLYYISDSNNGYTNTYCQMTPLTGCSGGGWTLVMKIDGKQETFNYSSSYWQNKESYNPTGGLSGLDNIETKLPSYWSTSLTQLCVGMKVVNNLKFIPIDFPASSLYSLIADRNHSTTYLGRQTWKSLISGSSLQTNCNKEGFNVKKPVGSSYTTAKVRIGIIGNQENNCDSPDSYLGFGGPSASKRKYCEIQSVINTCGNSATCSSDNGVKEIQAMGYIFVR